MSSGDQREKDREFIVEGLRLLKKKLEKDSELPEYFSKLYGDITYIDKLIIDIDDRLSDWI